MHRNPTQIAALRRAAANPLLAERTARRAARATAEAAVEHFERVIGPRYNRAHTDAWHAIAIIRAAQQPGHGLHPVQIVAARRTVAYFRQHDEPALARAIAAVIDACAAAGWNWPADRCPPWA